jgi:PHD/YefM family antitoxin component YafN of YafNO toxin-antitoxin module
MTTKFIGVREFRQNIAELYKSAQKKNVRYIVLNKNKPVFEVRTISEKDVPLERLLAITKEARAEARAGHTYSLESLEKELGIA